VDFHTWTFFGIQSCAFPAGSIFLSRFADHGEWTDLILAITALAIGNTFYYQLIKGSSSGLSWAFTLSTVGCLLAVSAYNASSIHAPQALGLGLVCCGFLIYALPTDFFFQTTTAPRG